MAKIVGFPRSLLKQSKQERLKYFSNFTIAHPRLVETYEELMRVIRRTGSGTLILVFGPSGVGKSTLLRRVQRQLTAERMTELEERPDLIPVVVDELVGPDSGCFNWKDFYRRLLISMDEPLVDRKVVYEKTEAPQSPRIYFKTGPRSVTADLRFAVEQTLKYRKPGAVLIDEAQHLAKMASGRKLEDQLDCLKSLSNQTGVLFVLMGTYELLAFHNLNAQLSRRTINVHFGRYRLDNKGDGHAFKSALLTFQKHLPLNEEPNLLARWDYFYERSLGCVGILKDWLARALGETLDQGSSRLTDKHVEMYAPSLSQCHKLLSDAIAGEKKLTDKKESLHELRVRLGLIGCDQERQSDQATLKLRKPVQRAHPRTKGRRGRRRAKRDPVAGREL